MNLVEIASSIVGCRIEPAHISPSLASGQVLIILDQLRLRLVGLGSIPFKYIIYGGDFGGDLAIALMDQVYGSLGYTIFAIDLPCYPPQLKEYIKEQVGHRANFVPITTGTSCEPSHEAGVVTQGTCSEVTSYLEASLPEISLNVCGCFFPERALEVFIAWHRSKNTQCDFCDFDQYWSLKIAGLSKRFHLFLFGQVPPATAELLAFQVDPGNADNWQWWRIHLCHGSKFGDVGAIKEQTKWHLSREEILADYQKTSR